MSLKTSSPNKAWLQIGFNPTWCLYRETVKNCSVPRGVFSTRLASSSTMQLLSYSGTMCRHSNTLTTPNCYQCQPRNIASTMELSVRNSGEVQSKLTATECQQDRSNLHIWIWSRAKTAQLWRLSKGHTSKRRQSRWECTAIFAGRCKASVTSELKYLQRLSLTIQLSRLCGQCQDGFDAHSVNTKICLHTTHDT